jgi:hypothetical protein
MIRAKWERTLREYLMENSEHGEMFGRISIAEVKQLVEFSRRKMKVIDTIYLADLMSSFGWRKKLVPPKHKGGAPFRGFVKGTSTRLQRTICVFRDPITQKLHLVYTDL